MNNCSIPFVINFLPLKLSCVSNFIRKYNCKQIKCAWVWPNEMTTVDDTKKRESIYTTISKRINEFKIAQNEPDLSIPRRKIEWTCRRIVCFSVGLNSYFSLSLVFLSLFLSFQCIFFCFYFICFVLFSFHSSCFALALCCFTSQHKGIHSLFCPLFLSTHLSLLVCILLCFHLFVSRSFHSFTFALCEPRSHSKDTLRPKIHICMFVAMNRWNWTFTVDTHFTILCLLDDVGDGFCWRCFCIPLRDIMALCLFLSV